eukprot:GFYU01001628.1.p1 GENE.GFYU01001628.1~~GFYU01001628.1.p1  ORF type:complete len:1847 (-),score=569.14 GFYU01001628.1:41-5581(-)
MGGKAYAGDGSLCFSGGDASDARLLTSEDTTPYYTVKQCSLRILIRQLVVDLTPVAITNWINFGGTRYATLDNAVHTDTQEGCQGPNMLLPSGWSIANADANALTVIKAFRFGTNCLVFADGSSYWKLSATDCGSGQLETAQTDSAQTTYAPAGCQRRILIIQSGQPGDNDLALVPITNSMVFNGYQYATLDNAVPTETTVGGHIGLVKLQTGWELAPDDATTWAAVQGPLYKYGTFCFVFANGRAAHHVRPQDSFFNCGTGQLVTSGDFIGVAGVNMRIMIRKATTDANTWAHDQTVSGANVYTGLGGVEFATMDGVSASSTTIACQDKSLKIPPGGWAIAAWDATTQAAVAAKVFGTNCLIVSDGTAYHHDGSLCAMQALMTVGDYHVSNICEAKVLLARGSGSFVTADITNYVTVGAYRYATVDNAAVADTADGCTDSLHAVPDGWEIASPDSTATLAAMHGHWGALCLLMTGNVGVATNTGASCNGGSIVDNGTAVQAAQCSVRILIRKAAEGGDVDLTTARAISHTFTFRGVDYATIDNTAPFDSSAGCQKYPIQLPTGWSLAADAPATLTAMMSPTMRFGTTCYVLAGGRSVYRNDPSQECGTGKLQNEGTYYMPTHCNQRVLISKTATVDNTPTEVAATAQGIYYRQGRDYVTLDSVTARDPVAGCQIHPLTIPSGWSLAPVDARTMNAIPKKFFGANCLILADGKSYDHQGNVCLGGATQLLSNENFHVVKTCSQRILLHRSAADIGYCQSWGDPHFVSFDGLLYDFYGIGDYKMMETNDGRLKVHTRQFVTGHAASNKATAIKIVDHKIVFDSDKTFPTMYTINVNGVDDTQVSGIKSYTVGAETVTIETYGQEPTAVSGLKGWIITDSLGNVITVECEVSSFGTPYLHVYVKLNQVLDQVIGLCGDWDYSLTAELKYPAGTALADGSTPGEIHNWGQNWRITNDTPEAERLFDYSSNAPNSYHEPEGFTAIYTFDELPESSKQIAYAACNNKGLDATFYSKCLFDVGVSGDPRMAGTTQNAQAKFDAGDKGEMTCPTTPVITNTVSFKGRLYATLDNTDPSATAQGCQLDAFPIPAGWSVAQDTPINRAAMACHTWGTNALVLDNGIALTPGLQQVGSGEMERGGDFLKCHTVRTCDKRILIVKDADAPAIPITNPSFESSQTGWDMYWSGFTLDNTAAKEGTHSVKISLSIPPNDPAPATYQAAAVQKVSIPSNINTEPFAVEAWSKASGVTGDPDSGYAVFIDVFYTDATPPTYGKTAMFNTGTHDFEKSSVDIYPAGPVDFIRIHLLFRGHSGDVWFDNLAVTQPSFNILKNGGFELTTSQSGTPALGWNIFNDGYSVTTDGTANRVLQVVKATTSEDPIAHRGGASQVVLGTDIQGLVAGGVLYVAGASKSTDASGSKDNHYSLWIDIQYTDNTWTYAQTIPFDIPTTTLTAASRFVQLSSTKTVKSIQISALFGGHSGTAQFDEIFATIIPCGGFEGSAVTYGDPHFVSLDGTAFDLQTIAEFTLAKISNAGGMEVQVRHSPAGAAAVTSAVAIKCVTGSVLTIDRGADGHDPIIKHNSVSLLMGQTLNVPFLSVARTGSLATHDLMYLVTCKEHTVEVGVSQSAFKVQYLRVNLKLGASAKSKTSGLLGIWDDNAANDFPTIADANVSLDPATATHDQLYNNWAKAFQVTDATSLFPYENQLTTTTVANSMLPQFTVSRDVQGAASFVDLAHFKEDAYNNVTPTQFSNAEKACKKAGLTGTAYEACVTDSLLTNDQFTDGAAETQAAVSSAQTQQDTNNASSRQDTTGLRAKTGVTPASLELGKSLGSSAGSATPVIVTIVVALLLNVIV